MTVRLSVWWRRVQIQSLLVAGRRQAALERVANHLVTNPTDPYLLGTRAQLLSQAGHTVAALQAQEALVRAQPGLASAWFNWGYMLEQAGRLPEARTAFEEATRLAPQLDRAWYGLGLVLIQLHCFDEAVAALRKNTELQPMSPYGWYQLARVHVDRQEPDEAVKIIRRLRQFEPKVAAQLERETGLRAAPSA